MDSVKHALAARKDGGQSCPDCAPKTRHVLPVSKPQESPGTVGREPSQGAALGIYAKTEAATPKTAPHTIWTKDGETGEATPFEAQDKAGFVEFVLKRDPQLARAERYALKSVVNKLAPKSRTAKCMRWRLPSHKVTVNKAHQYNKAFYTGLQVCGRVWSCPVCSAKIAERRRVELTTATALAKAQGMQVMLLTLTVPHGLGDDLGTMLDRMGQAWRKTSTERRGKALRKSLDVKGTIRALEVTHGKNGWHPHFHVLLFVGQGVTAEQIFEAYAPLWQTVCVKAGLPEPSLAHGTRVDDGSYAAAYVGKWGLEAEMTRGHSKKGGHGSLTPFDLLRCYLDSKCKQSARLFLDYLEAFKGRRQLYWSNGLRDVLGMSAPEMTDEEVAHSQEEEASILSELTDEQWRAVLRTRNEAALLNVAENNPESITCFLEGVVVLASLEAEKTPRKPHTGETHGGAGGVAGGGFAVATVPRISIQQEIILDGCAEHDKAGFQQ